MSKDYGAGQFVRRVHESYIVPGVVDGDVVREQAIRRRDKDGETTIVHDHPYDEPAQTHSEHATPDGRMRTNCNEKCSIYQPGLQTITYFDFRQGAIALPIKEEA